MLDVAEDYDVTPGRNNAGEMSFTYFPESSVYKILNKLPTPKGTPQGNEAAAANSKPRRCSLAPDADTTGITLL